MIRALFFDSLNRIKWLVLSYLCVVAVYSWEKISIFVTDKPIPAGGSQWNGSLMAALCILAVSIISWLIPYDKLTSQDAFWATRPPRLRHHLLNHTLVLSLTIALPLALSESVISILWGNPITTLSVFLQSFAIIFSIVFIIQILATGSRNPFKSIGIIVAAMVVFLVITSNIQQLLPPIRQDQHTSVASALFIVSILSAIVATTLCIKRKVEWPHTAAAIFIASLLATSQTINIQSHPFSTTQSEAPLLPFDTSIEVEVPSATQPNQNGGRKYTLQTSVSIREIPADNFLVAIQPQLANGEKTKSRIELSEDAVLTGFRVQRDETGGLHIAQDGALRLASRRKRAAEILEESPVTFETLWIQYQLEDYKLLTGMKEQQYLKNGILSKMATSQSLPVPVMSDPPTPAILHATTRPWSEYPSPFQKAGAPRTDLPAPNTIQRIYYIEYQDGSSRCIFPSQQGNNRDKLLPISWQTIPLSSYRERHDAAKQVTAVYALDIRHVATWKSSQAVNVE